MIHTLKTWTAPFQAIWDGRKTAEFRRNDRGFEVGHRLHLMEYDPDEDSFSRRSIFAIITDVTRGPSFGIPQGYAMLSIQATRGIEGDTIVWYREAPILAVPLKKTPPSNIDVCHNKYVLPPHLDPVGHHAP